MDAIQNIKFLRNISVGAITASATLPISLGSYKRDFGDNWNTFTITNTSASLIVVILDGQEVMTLTGNNGVWSFDHQDGITYNEIAIKELSAANIDADKIKLTIGRTGV